MKYSFKLIAIFIIKFTRRKKAYEALVTALPAVDAAINNAKDIDDAGYNIAIRKGGFLTCYGVDKKGGTIEEILSSLLEGNP